MCSNSVRRCFHFARRWAVVLVAIAAFQAVLATPQVLARQSVTSAPTGDLDFDGAQTLFNERCAVCHGLVGDAGRPYPRWLGDTHAVYTMSEAELLVFLRQTMPLDQPGSLTEDEYQALVRFLRKTTLGR